MTKHTDSHEGIRILILEDNPVDSELLENELREAGFVFHSKLVTDSNNYIKALREFCPDIIISDYDLPSFTGAKALDVKKEHASEVPFILVTGAVGEERAIDMLTRGATDYVLKRNLSRIVPAVRRALEELYEHRKRKEAEAQRDSLLKELESRVEERTEALRKSEHLLKTALERTSTGVWILSPQGELKVSPQIKILFGHPADSPEKDFLDFYNQIHPDDRSRVEQAWKKAIDSGEIYSEEYRIVWPDGSIHWLSSKGQVSTEMDGTQFIGIIHEITEHKQVEEALRKTELRQSFLLKLGDALRPVIDPVEVQAETCRMLGEYLKADRACYSEVHQDEDIAFIRTDYFRNGLTSAVGRYRLSDFDELLSALQNGRPFSIPDAECSAFISAKARSTLLERNVRAYVTVPIVRNGKLTWTLNIAFSTKRDWSTDEIALIQEVADRTWAITEKLRSEEELRESEELFHALVKASSEYLYRMSPDWSELKELYGGGLRMSRGPIRSWIKRFIYPDDVPIVMAAVKKAIREKSFLELENRVWRPDGSLGWAFSRAVPMMDEKGEIKEWFGAINDITERKEAEENLRESEEKYRLIFQSSISGILITTPDGSVIAANPSAQKILDMTEEEIIRNGIDGIVDTSDTRFQMAMEKRARTGKFFGELNWKRKNGRTFPGEVSSVIYWSERGQAFASVIFIDISWWKEAEQILKDNEQRFRQMADAMPGIVFTGTPDGHMDYINKRYEEVPGIKRGPDGFWEWRLAIHPDDLPAVVEIFSQSIASQTDFQAEYRMKEKSGIYRWYLSRCLTLRNKEGHLIKWVGTTIDIHDLKEAETALKERTKLLEEANKELESFSYSVSHDLRAPLRAIDGFSRMFLSKEHEFDQETNRKIHIIRKNAEKMDRLINDLLYFSKSGRAAISRSKISMELLVTEIWQDQLSANPDRMLELKKEPLPNAVGDENLIRQVLSNLISNAVKFSKRKETAMIEIGSNSNAKENVYYVKDNGAGFDMEYSNKLFGVFQRLHSESDYEGTGIGLAIVQRIVHRHGGRVWAEGAVGKGAIFYFALPNRE
jgi:PAS domain S-box-containing protein